MMREFCGGEALSVKKNVELNDGKEQVGFYV